MHITMKRLLATVTLFSVTAAAHAQIQGPTSSQTPYMLPKFTGISTTSLLTVGDIVNRPNGTPYRGMVGIPDGLGAYDNGDGTASIFMNHEIGASLGVVRDHGSVGSFVSNYNVNIATKAVVNGEDLVKNLNVVTGTTAMGRLCSADLAPVSAFSFGATGTTARLFMNGEETGAEGRAFAHIASGPNKGTSYELPRLGKFSWENSVASPFAQSKTVVIGTDDTTPGQVYVYVGNKTDTGNEVERAGLTNGNLYGVRVPGTPAETRATGIVSGTVFNMFNHGDVSALSGAQLQSNSTGAGVTEFLRPEDGAWNPVKPNEFYFVTTDRFDQTKNGTGAQVGRSRLYRMTFTDITTPEAGGRIDMLLDGTGDYQMMDNIAISQDGKLLLIQEDPGGVSYTAKIRAYNMETGAVTLIAEHDVSRFGREGLAPTAPFSNDEESSGIIDVSDIFGAGSYLFDVQAHYPVPGGEFIEGGQLLLMQGLTIAAVPEPSTYILCSLGAAAMGGYIYRTRKGNTRHNNQRISKR